MLFSCLPQFTVIRDYNSSTYFAPYYQSLSHFMMYQATPNNTSYPTCRSCWRACFVGIGVNQSCWDSFIEVAWGSSMLSVENELKVGSLTVGLSGYIIHKLPYHVSLFRRNWWYHYIWKCLHDYSAIMHFHLFES